MKWIIFKVYEHEYMNKCSYNPTQLSIRAQHWFPLP